MSSCIFIRFIFLLINCLFYHLKLKSRFKSFPVNTIPQHHRLIILMVKLWQNIFCQSPKLPLNFFLISGKAAKIHFFPLCIHIDVFRLKHKLIRIHQEFGQLFHYYYKSFQNALNILTPEFFILKQCCYGLF